MEFRLLGDVEVCDSRGLVLPLGSRQRAVLAVLLYRANAVVPRSELIRLVWGPQEQDWPATVEQLVTDYVSHLRGPLDRIGARVRLVARTPGFVAELDAQLVDWHRFRGLCRQARAARQAGQDAAAVPLLRAALAHTAARLLDPARDPALLPLAPPAPGTTPEQPADYREALTWLDAEQPVLPAALRLAAETGFDTHTWQLAWALHTFLDRRGHWQNLAGAWQAAATAADRLTHPTAAAYAHRCLAWASTRLGHYDEADTRLRRALDLYTQASDRAGQARAHRVLAYLWER